MINKIHRDPIHLEHRRQQLVRDIRNIAAAKAPMRFRLEKIRRRQKALNLINKRLGT